ncbi:ribbon-helix-helix protein, CopG family [Salinicoccus sp. CNSTN-B1]|jgi:metal-responsive CopG/Arc/MetJ family transcriptional regulator
MTREKVGITLTEETLKRLDEISKELGLTKSQAISMLINQEYLNNFREENQVFKQ